MSIAADIQSLVKWWFVLFVLGALFFPLTCRLFPRFFDRGYLFAKVIGLGGVAYAVWFCASVRLVAFSWTAFLFVLLVPLLLYALLPGVFKKTALPGRAKIKILAAEEALFLCALVLWSYVRGLQPDIRGLEKFMDFGFVNACLRTSFMPPEDMWYAGAGINYYYFGQFVTALLSRLTGVAPALAYNLMIATLFAFTLTLSFSVAANALYCTRRFTKTMIVAGGAVSALLVSVGGNLHAAVYAYILPALQKINLYRGVLQPYWYPDATRYIGYNPPVDDKTIHEFPLYSFVVSDLHAHVVNIIFVLTFLALLLSWTVRARSGANGGWGGGAGQTYVPAGFLLAVFYMTNAWDFFIFVPVTIVFVIALNAAVAGSPLTAVKTGARDLLLIGALAALAAAPFLAAFEPFSHGIGRVHSTTPLYQFLVLWGAPLMLALLYALLPGRGDAAAGRETGPDLFVALIVLCGLGLIAAPEFVYVKDIYPPAYHRSNTMFKCGYQAFILFGLASGFIIITLQQRCRTMRIVPKAAVTGVLLLCVTLPLLYPAHAVRGYYGGIEPSRYKGLDGLSFLALTSPDDYESIAWLHRNVTGRAVVLEANGDSYTDYGRISMATGLPTVLGWFVHQWLWRGAPEPVQARARDVAAIYESDDPAVMRCLLRQYCVAYVVVGELERRKFSGLRIDTLLQAGSIVFENATVQIIRVE